MFYRFDKRIIYAILAICIVTNLMQLSQEGLISLLMSVPGVLIAITFHEWAHAFAAYKLGDSTAKLQGRLSLNPFKHMDLIGIIMLLFVGFGWGKPVQIDSRNFKRNMSKSKAEAIVAVAGPLMNFFLAIVFTVIMAIMYKFGVYSRTGAIVFMMISATVTMNIGLGVFNLIPLPPLDGSKVLNHFLPYRAKEWFAQNEYIFYIIFLVIWITGIAGTIISPIISWIYSGLVNIFII